MARELENVIKWIRKLFHKHIFVEQFRYLMWTGEDYVLSKCECGKVHEDYTLDTYFGRAKAPSYIEFFNSKKVKA